MKQQNNTTRDRAMNNINSMLNQHHISHNHNQSQMSPSSSDFDPTSSHDGFLEQMLSSAAAGTFPWSDDHAPPHLDEHMGLHQISNKELMLQHHQQLLLSNGILPDHNVDASFLKSANQDNDAAVKAIFNGFTGSLNQATNHSQNFHNSQAQDFGTPAAPSASGAGKQKPRVRARRGQATDPHSIAERLRRERIADRMKALQELVPNPNKTDKASMLDEIIDYVKFLQLQVKVLSMSRLGGAAAAAANPVANNSPEGRRSSNGTQTAPPSNNNEGMSVSENQVVKMMEEDMGSAMQYLQGKGLCLMPISLATAISTSTCHTRINPLARTNNINGNGEDGGPSSPNMSVLTAQSAAMGGSGGVEVSVKDATTSVLKMDSSS